MDKFKLLFPKYMKDSIESYGSVTYENDVAYLYDLTPGDFAYYINDIIEHFDIMVYELEGQKYIRFDDKNKRFRQR